LEGRNTSIQFIPKNWDHYSFKINYRGRLIEVYIDHQEIKLTLIEGQTIDVWVKGEKVTLKKVRVNA